MKRRQLLVLAGVGTAWPLLRLGYSHAAPPGEPATIAQMQARWRSFRALGAAVIEPLPALERSNDEWLRQLPDAAYDVLFEEDTEPPFSSPLNDEKRSGIFACSACALPLFTSEMKYDSGTGWPSFFTTIPGHLASKTDFKLIWPRTEYHCVKCGGHQGHVFDDGPAPTGQRWCNNGLALSFSALAH